MLLSGGRLATAIISLIAIRAVSTFLSPEQYGELSLLIAVQMLCGLFLVNPVGQHINLHTHEWWDDRTLMGRLKSYRSYILAVSLTGMAVVIFLSKLHSLNQMYLTAVSMFVMVAMATWNATLIPMLNMLGFRAASVFWGIVTLGVGLAVSVMLIFLYPSPVAWFSGQAVGMGFGALGSYFVLRRHSVESSALHGSFKLIDKDTVITYCLPLALATWLMWIQLSGYRFLIEKYYGLAQLGFMAIGLQLASQIWSLAESLAMQFLYPLFYRRVTELRSQAEFEYALSDLVNTLIPLYTILTGLLIASAPYLLKVLVASRYQSAINFLVLGVGIEMCRVLGNVFSNAAHVRRKTKSLALPYGTGAITALILIYQVGVNQMPIIWATLALLVGGIAMLSVMTIGMYQQVKFTLDIARCFVGLLFMAVMIVLSFFLPAFDGVMASIGMLIFLGTLSAVVVFALMRINPAMLRLLSVKLREF